MRRHAQQDLALGEPLAHQAKVAMLQIAQPAMDQLARRRGGRAGEIALVAKQHSKAAPGRIASDPDAIDAAADDEQIECPAHPSRASANSTKPAPASRSVM